MEVNIKEELKNLDRTDYNKVCDLVDKIIEDNEKRKNMSFDEWLNCDRKGGSFSENIKIFIEQKNIDGIINLLSEAYKQAYDNGCFEVLLASKKIFK